MKTNRNSPCTCGSGMKYKQCCGQKEGKSSPFLVIVALVIGAVIVAGAIYVSKDGQPAAADAQAVPAAAGSAQTDIPGSPQPPGPVPPGKVWNVEHGHWHDAPGTAAAAGTPGQPGAAQPGAISAQPGAAQPALTPGPQPPGPVPAGKVWSTEHGHWHDAPK
jgi:hypothetical protein